MKPTSRVDGVVTKNGQTLYKSNLLELAIGDTFSLLGNRQFYNFVLKEKENKKRKFGAENDLDPPSMTLDISAATSNDLLYQNQQQHPQLEDPNQSYLSIPKEAIATATAIATSS